MFLYYIHFDSLYEIVSKNYILSVYITYIKFFMVLIFIFFHFCYYVYLKLISPRCIRIILVNECVLSFGFV